MEKKDLSRRDFIKTTGAGLAGAAVLSGSLGSFAKKAFAVNPPELPIEKGAVLKVLRWSPFVKTDGEYWEKNTKKMGRGHGRQGRHRNVVLGGRPAQGGHGKPRSEQATISS